MYSLDKLQAFINAEIEGTYKTKQPSNLYEPIEYSMSVGGKRIRPLLCLMSSNLFSDQVEEAIKPAVGLETFHNFTLLHDDIMDKAEVRRSQPTVHKKWDENTAILSGDAMMIEAYDYFLGLSPNLLSSTFKIFNKTALEVCEGQQYDMDFETQSQVSEQEYLEMIRLKTAVLIAASLKVGAIIGGAKGKDSNNIYDFGIAMGLAFQLQDDYLDTFGDEATFGKKIGGDILENKKTFLLINALDKDQAKIQALLDINQAEEKVERVTEAYRELGIDQLTQEKILEYYHKALEALGKVEVEESKKQLLLDFLNQLKDRIV